MLIGGMGFPPRSNIRIMAVLSGSSVVAVPCFASISCNPLASSRVSPIGHNANALICSRLLAIDLITFGLMRGANSELHQAW